MWLLVERHGLSVKSDMKIKKLFTKEVCCLGGLYFVFSLFLT